MSNSPEKISFGPEHEHNPQAIREAGDQQRELLRSRHEQGEKSAERSVDDARHEVEKITQEHEQLRHEETDHQPSPAERRRDGPIGKREREASFKSTMSEVQSQMSAPSRAFSKVIHNKTIEKASDVAASTVARPNAMLSGAVFAFILTLAVYLVAKNIGYPLSGFETIGAFILGWVLGLLYDFFKVMITGRK